MKRLITLNLILGSCLFITSCAILSTSMTPSQVNETLPSLTTSKFIPLAQAEEDMKADGCRYLVKGRSYSAPIGLTTKEDLRNGAKGIDEWVRVDGGNAYVLRNYKWVSVAHDGSTQLHVDFDTVLCK